MIFQIEIKENVDGDSYRVLCEKKNTKMHSALDKWLADGYEFHKKLTDDCLHGLIAAYKKMGTRRPGDVIGSRWLIAPDYIISSMPGTPSAMEPGARFVVADDPIPYYSADCGLDPAKSYPAIRTCSFYSLRDRLRMTDVSFPRTIEDADNLLSIEYREGFKESNKHRCDSFIGEHNMTIHCKTEKSTVYQCEIN